MLSLGFDPPPPPPSAVSKHRKIGYLALLFLSFSSPCVAVAGIDLAYIQYKNLAGGWVLEAVPTALKGQ